MGEPPEHPSVSTTPSARVVRDTLLEYARRGVFRGFDHQESDGGIVFRFYWMGPRPYHLVLKPGSDGTDTLTARDLLPVVDDHPGLRADLEGLVGDRSAEFEDESDSGGGAGEDGSAAPSDGGPEGEPNRDAATLPPHRRIDPALASAALAPDGRGGLDLVISVRNGQHEYAARKLLNLINEIWVRLQDRHQRYMWEVFQAPME